MPWTFSCQLPRAVRTKTGIAIPASRQRRKHGQAIHLRKSEVENHRVVPLRSSQKVGALAVGGAVHGVTGGAQCARKLFRQRGFVLDHQDAHAF